MTDTIKCRHVSTQDIQTSLSTSSGDLDFPISTLATADSQILIAKTQHETVKKLMRRVYAILAGDGSSNPSCSAYRQTGQQKSGQQRNKRQEPDEKAADHGSDRGSQPSNGGRDSRQRPNKRQKVKTRPERYLACPFYKHNPQKYCANSSTGPKYRTCSAAPGFEDMRRLR